MANRARIVAGMLLVFVLVPSWAVAADTRDEDLRQTIEALKQRLQDQERRIAELEAKQAATSSPASDQKEQIRQVIQEMKADAKEGLGPPSWLENLKLFGDLRLRYAGQYYKWNKANGEPKKNFNAARFRLRAGLTKTWLDDQLEVTFRLASGSDNAPTSTNQTLTDDFQKKPVWIDLAYARYAPQAVKGLTLIGGKMNTPWVTNEIFIDTDVNPEGFWAGYKLAKMGFVEPFVGAGYFFLHDSADTTSVTLGVYQAGAKFQITHSVKYTLAGIYQDYMDYAVDPNARPNGNDSPLTLIPNFRVLGVSNALEFPLHGLPVTLSADWSHNCSEEDPTAKYQNQNNAYAAGIKLGQNKKKGDWSLRYRYARVEADALPGYFVDADFGYANRQGHIVGGAYNILDSLTAEATVLLTEPTFTPTSTSGASPAEDKTTTLLLDLVWKF